MRMSVGEKINVISAVAKNITSSALWTVSGNLFHGVGIAFWNDLEPECIRAKHNFFKSQRYQHKTIYPHFYKNAVLKQPQCRAAIYIYHTDTQTVRHERQAKQRQTDRQGH